MEEQTFTAACFTQNDHLIGCSNFGDIFVIEGMDVQPPIDTTQLVTPGTFEGTRLNFKFIVACRFGFVIASPDVLYFFKYFPSKDPHIAKGEYACILKWRAPEFKDTYITSLSIQEGDEKSPLQYCNLAVSTKNNQIIYLNLYKQVYYPDCVLIQ